LLRHKSREGLGGPHGAWGTSAGLRACGRGDRLADFGSPTGGWGTQVEVYAGTAVDVLGIGRLPTLVGNSSRGLLGCT
jgi:hypothetical protein